MVDKELLEAIGQLMDAKLAGFATTGDLEGLATKKDIGGLATKEDVEKAERQMRVVVENGYQRIENLLREDYSRIEGNAAKGATAADRQKELESTVTDHDRALKNHNERISVLEKKAI